MGRTGFFLVAAAFALLSTTGCAVPQPRGNGILTREKEPRTGRHFWQYLPEGYVKADAAARKARRWPLVVSFHGMKPFDNAHPQAREWQQEADRYGYLVLAPELKSPDLLAEFPLKRVHPAFKDDELATLAILDHVFATTDADPSNVLATSWSSGGYMAHYMANHHPNRFTCVSVRQSNFASAVMDPSMAPRCRYHPILIVNTENDFKICKEESAEAIRWYEGNGYQNLFWVRIKGLGHERTPDMAAHFFALVSGVRPNAPAMVLAQRQTIDGNVAGLNLLAGNSTPLHAAPVRQSPADSPAIASLPPTPARRSYLLPADSYAPGAAGPRGDMVGAPADAVLVRGLPKAGEDPLSIDHYAAAPVEQSQPTPSRSVRGASALSEAPVRVRVSSTIGIEPLLLGFSVDCPSDWMRSADFLWTLDGEAVCSGVNGQRTINAPGNYELAVLVVTPDGKEHRAAHSIRVLPRLTSGE